jgi:uncharacterized protein YecE (DUF72 family)
MEFGKLEDISAVDFRLPPDPPATGGFLAGLPAREHPPRLYLGCTGWNMREWVGTVYPKGAKSKDYLREYARQFNTIELNTTHYRIPDEATVQRWKEESAPDFRFCPKVPQSISHSNNLGLGTPFIPAFCKAVEGLGEKLGCCFLQLPPYFGQDRLALLEAFLRAFPRHIPLALELRHESWFKPTEKSEALFQLMGQTGVAAVITDVAGRRDVLHQRLTASRTLVRFVGNGLHPTDYSRADAWIERLAQWYEAGVAEVFFFTHEPDNLQAPELAAYFLEKTRQVLPQVRTRGPELRGSERTGEQMSLF